MIIDYKKKYLKYKNKYIILSNTLKGGSLYSLWNDRSFYVNLHLENYNCIHITNFNCIIKYFDIIKETLQDCLNTKKFDTDTKDDNRIIIFIERYLSPADSVYEDISWEFNRKQIIDLKKKMDDVEIYERTQNHWYPRDSPFFNINSAIINIYDSMINKLDYHMLSRNKDVNVPEYIITETPKLLSEGETISTIIEKIKNILRTHNTENDYNCDSVLEKDNNKQRQHRRRK